MNAQRQASAQPARAAPAAASTSGAGPSGAPAASGSGTPGPTLSRNQARRAAGRKSRQAGRQRTQEAAPAAPAQLPPQQMSQQSQKRPNRAGQFVQPGAGHAAAGADVGRRAGFLRNLGPSAAVQAASGLADSDGAAQLPRKRHKTSGANTTPAVSEQRHGGHGPATTAAAPEVTGTLQKPSASGVAAGVSVQRTRGSSGELPRSGSGSGVNAVARALAAGGAVVTQPPSGATAAGDGADRKSGGRFAKRNAAKAAAAPSTPPSAAAARPHAPLAAAKVVVRPALPFWHTIPRLMLQSCSWRRVQSSAQQATSTATACIPPDPQGRVTVLFDLNGVLIKAKSAEERAAGVVHAFEARRGVRHLVSLWPHFRLGLFTSATERTAQARLRKLDALLWRDPLTAVLLRAKGLTRSAGGEGALFDYVLTRQHCRPDAEWRARAGGNEWDTVKPLALHGFDVRRTVLFDDSVRKVLASETRNVVAIPEFREGAGLGVVGGGGGANDAVIHDADTRAELRSGQRAVPLLRVLCASLMRGRAALGEGVDVREWVPGHLTKVLHEVLAMRVPPVLEDIASAPAAPLPYECPSLFCGPAPDVAFHALPAAHEPLSPHQACPDRASKRSEGSASPSCVGMDPRPLVLLEASALLPLDAWEMIQAENGLADALLDNLHTCVAHGTPPPEPLLARLQPLLRPGVQHLLTLLPAYRLGVCTTGQQAHALAAARAVTLTLVQQLSAAQVCQPEDPREADAFRPPHRALFEVVLHERHACTVASGGQAIALSELGIDGRRCVVVGMGEDARACVQGHPDDMAVCLPLPAFKAAGTLRAAQTAQAGVSEGSCAVAARPQEAHDGVTYGHGPPRTLPGLRAVAALLSRGAPGARAANEGLRSAWREILGVPEGHRGSGAAQAASSETAQALAKSTMQSLRHPLQPGAHLAVSSKISAKAREALTGRAVELYQLVSGALRATADTAVQARPPFGRLVARCAADIDLTGAADGAATPVKVEGAAGLQASDAPTDSGPASPAGTPLADVGAQAARSGEADAPVVAIEPSQQDAAQPIDVEAAAAAAVHTPRAHASATIDMTGPASAAAAPPRAPSPRERLLQALDREPPSAAPSPTQAAERRSPPRLESAPGSPLAGDDAVGNAAVFTPPHELAPLAAEGSDKSLLHWEVYEFARRCTPTAAELDDLKALMLSVQQAVATLWPAAKVLLFGSQVNGMALRGSDLDIVVLDAVPHLSGRPGSGFEKGDKERVVAALRDLSAALRRRGLHRAADATLIENARVPIIKTALAFARGSRKRRRQRVPADITVGVRSGAEAVAFVHRQQQALPPLRPLVLALKCLLGQYRLNDARYGGLSSCALTNMVIAYLQTEGWAAAPLDGAFAALPPADVDAQLLFSRTLAAAAAKSRLSHAALWPADLGVLLMDFLNRFGFAFDEATQGLSVRQGGLVRREDAAAAAAGGAPGPGVAIEDPQQPGYSVGAAARNFSGVKQAFAAAWELLDAGLRAWETASLEATEDRALLSAPPRAGKALPPAAASLLLGKVISLDLALGPSEWPYSELRQQSALAG